MSLTLDNQTTPKYPLEMFYCPLSVWTYAHFSMKGGCRSRTSRKQLYLWNTAQINKHYGSVTVQTLLLFQLETLKEINAAFYHPQKAKLLPSQVQITFSLFLGVTVRSCEKQFPRNYAFQKPPYSKHLKLGNWWKGKHATFHIGRFHTGEITFARVFYRSS